MGFVVTIIFCIAGCSLAWCLETAQRIDSKVRVFRSKTKLFVGYWYLFFVSHLVPGTRHLSFTAAAAVQHQSPTAVAAGKKNAPENHKWNP